MEKTVYITEEEREKCRKVIDVFEELYEIEHTYTYTPLCEYLMACATFMDI